MVIEDISNPKNFSLCSMKKIWDVTGVGQIMVKSIDNKDTESYEIVDTNGEYPRPFF